MTTQIQEHDSVFINNDWVKAASSERIDVINPKNEQVFASVPESSPADIDKAVAAAREAFDAGPWPGMQASDRADIMEKLSQIIQADSQNLADLITDEVGTPKSFSIAGQVFASTMVLDYYTKLARQYQFEEFRSGVMGPNVVRQEAVGVVAAITPWNVPLFTIMLKLAPAMAAGCTMVLKPAPETPLDAYKLAEYCQQAGVPAGVVNVVPAGRENGEYLVRHPDVDKVSFTGSSAAGRKIASACGEQLKHCTLELGGKSAAILLDDADLNTVIPGMMTGATLNTGQGCALTTRILASKKKYNETVAALSTAIAAMPTGDPMDDATAFGPLVAERQRTRVLNYIDIGKKEGARVALGGGRPADLPKGWYVEPTIFADVDNKMRIAQEEIFGPVLCVIPYDDEADAIAIANDSDYGLSGSVWTNDYARGLDIGRAVRTGTFTINGFTIEFESPFGGYKGSGLGRELGPEGLQAYLQSKTISLPADYKA